MFLALLNGEGTATLGERGIEKKSGSLWVYGNRLSGRIGYFYIAEKNEGSGEREIELLMAGIEKEQRNKGHGRNMIKNFMAICPSTSTLYARCYPESKSMYSLLIAAGFVEINKKPGGTRELQLVPT